MAYQASPTIPRRSFQAAGKGRSSQTSRTGMVEGTRVGTEGVERDRIGSCRPLSALPSNSLQAPSPRIHLLKRGP